MSIAFSNNQNSYTLLDSGDGEKLERFGKYILRRPAAQAVWKKTLDEHLWANCYASFDRKSGKRWHGRNILPESFTIEIDGMRFKLSGTDFGHLGIFPEQREMWTWIRDVLQKAQIKRRQKEISVLNLFAYSGGSTLAALLAGAKVCHVDASRGMISWAKENIALNNLADASVRFIVDDVIKFMKREKKRGNAYDAIILDPPTFGRGAQGEVYKIENDIIPTLELVQSLLSEKPLFILFSCHTPGFSPQVMENLLQQLESKAQGKIEKGEMFLRGNKNVYSLPNGTWARWIAHDFI